MTIHNKALKKKEKKLQRLTYTNNEKRTQILRKKPLHTIQRRVFVMDEFANAQSTRAYTILLLLSLWYTVITAAGARRREGAEHARVLPSVELSPPSIGRFTTVCGGRPRSFASTTFLITRAAPLSPVTPRHDPVIRDLYTRGPNREAVYEHAHAHTQTQKRTRNGIKHLNASDGWGERWLMQIRD